MEDTGENCPCLYFHQAVVMVSSRVLVKNQPDSCSSSRILLPEFSLTPRKSGARYTGP